MVDESRRRVIKSALGVGAAGLMLGAGFVSAPAWAAPDISDWPKAAFDLDEIDKAIKGLWGQSAQASDKVVMQAPTIAQNGAVVPVTVESSLPNVTALALFVEKNPYALTAMYEIPEGTAPFVSNRIKMAETSRVVAVAVSDGKPYSTEALVKVTIGGCGG